MCLNHPELGHNHPANLVIPVTINIEKVRYGRTTPNSCDKTLHTLLSPYMISFEDEPPLTRVKDVYILCYLCEDAVREGSTGAYSTLHTLYPLKSCSQRRFGTVEGSMRFDVLEHHRTAYALVWTQRTSSNLLKTHDFRDSKVCGVLSHKCEVDRQHRTSITAAVQRNQLQGGCAPVRGGSSTANLIAPPHHTSLQRKQGV